MTTDTVSNKGAATLSAHHLQKRYGSRTVVRDVSIEVKCGEVVGLLGPNGSGKTTSFYMIVGLVPLDGGDINLDGTDITYGQCVHISAFLHPSRNGCFRRRKIVFLPYGITFDTTECKV